MRKEQTAIVTRVEYDDMWENEYTAHLDNGHEIRGDALDKVPLPGAKVNVTYTWGDDYVAPVVPIKRARVI